MLTISSSSTNWLSNLILLIRLQCFLANPENQFGIDDKHDSNCFDMDTAFVTWWRKADDIGQTSTKAISAKQCQILCVHAADCYFWTWFSDLRIQSIYKNNCLMYNTRGSTMRLYHAVSGPKHCLTHAHLNSSSINNDAFPIRSCLVFGNGNPQFQYPPFSNQNLPMLIPLEKTDLENRLNMLLIKLQVQKRLLIYLIGKHRQSFSDDSAFDNTRLVIDLNFEERINYGIHLTRLVDDEIDESKDVVEPRWMNGQFIKAEQIDQILVRKNGPNDSYHIHVHGVQTNANEPLNNLLTLEYASFGDFGEVVYINSAYEESFVSNVFHCTNGKNVLKSRIDQQFMLNFNPEFTIPPLYDNVVGGMYPINYVAIYGRALGTTFGGFKVDFLTSMAPNFDSIFTFSVCFWQNYPHVVRNAKLNGNWGEEEVSTNRNGWFPFEAHENRPDLAGNFNFTRLDFAFKRNSVNVAVNGVLYCEFKFRNSVKPTAIIAMRISKAPSNDNGDEFDEFVPFELFGVDVKFIEMKT